MSRTTFAILVISIATVALLAMWLGWRARTRRDAGVLTGAVEATGRIVAEFRRVFYVSTTPVGQPLVRVAVPGMRYRGPSDIVVHTDGVTLQVDGEAPVHFAAAQIQGSGSASRRVGKAVEQGGLALMTWLPSGRSGAAGDQVLESSFRFAEKAEQRRFADAITQICMNDAAHEATLSTRNTSSQEDKK